MGDMDTEANATGLLKFSVDSTVKFIRKEGSTRYFDPYRRQERWPSRHDYVFDTCAAAMSPKKCHILYHITR